MTYLEKRLNDKNVELAILIIIISCIILSITIPPLNKTYYYVPSGTSAISDISYDGTGSDNVFSSTIDLRNGDSMQIYFKTVTEKPATVIVDLYGGKNYDENGMELTFNIPAGEQSFSDIISYYHTSHPDTCELRFIIMSDSKVNISSIVTNNLRMVKGGHEVILMERIIILIVLLTSVLLLLYALKSKSKNKAFHVSNLDKNSIRKILRSSSVYVLLAVSVTGILLFLYRNAIITYPLTYNPLDEMGVFDIVKKIDEFGISLISTRSGGAFGTSMYDYPFAELLSFFLVKFISLFTDNPYLTTNLFYFLCFYIIAFTSYTVMKFLGFHTTVSFVFSILYSFSPYIQRRYHHMWLVPYFTVPVICYIAITVIKDAVNKETSEISYERFYKLLFAAYLCGFTGVYYAFFGCAVFSLALLILLLNKKNVSVKRRIYPVGYILSTATGVLINVVPFLLFSSINGVNNSGETVVRSSNQSEIYALRMIQLILPHDSHRLSFLRNLTLNYDATHFLINENSMVSLGFIATAGFIISLILLFRTDSKDPSLSYINIAAFCLGTFGGISSIFSFFINTAIRSYNRLSTVIMFISLLQIALLIEYLRNKTNVRISYVILAVILIVGIFDQTYDYPRPDYTLFESDKDAINKIEALMPEDSIIFQMPYVIYPASGLYRHFIGFIESDTLRWNFGCFSGRDEEAWQRRVASTKDLKKMIHELKQAGYDGLYFDSYLCELTGDKNAGKNIDTITSILGTPDVVSDTRSIYFWKFR